MAQNYKTADDFLLFRTAIFLAFLVIFFVFINQKISQRIDEIGEL